MHLLHCDSYEALWNVGLLIEGESLLYCVNNFKMAVCFGQSMDSLHPESAPPSELFRCVPTSLPPPSGARGHSVSLLALTIALALSCSPGGEGIPTVAKELIHCVCALHLHCVS